MPGRTTPKSDGHAARRKVNSVAGEGARGGRESETIVGIAFDADELGLEKAELRAWQMLMERLDPQELRGSALYHGPVLLPSGKHQLIVAISGPQNSVTYVRNAFSAPDLVAFPGMLPIAQRIINANDLPREYLSLVGYINDRGALLLTDWKTELVPLAQHARWQLSNHSQPLPNLSLLAPESDNQPEHTHSLRVARTDGATQTNMRTFQRTNRERPLARRRLVFALIGTLLILISLGIVASRIIARQLLAKDLNHTPTVTQPTAPPTAIPQAILVVAPLNLKVPCQVGHTTQFIISNNGTADLEWSSNGALFAPRLQLTQTSGTIPPGDSLSIQVGLGQVVKNPQQVVLVIQSNGGTLQITATLGVC